VLSYEAYANLTGSMLDSFLLMTCIIVSRLKVVAFRKRSIFLDFDVSVLG
jgi:hypothetical protein